MYEERFYRKSVEAKFSLRVSLNESDLLVSTDTKIEENVVYEILKKYYRKIESYIKTAPHFATSLSPLREDLLAPAIIRDMIARSKVAGIGPFSSVAGAIAFYVGRDLLSCSNEVIVENGGDVFLKINENKKLAVYLGERFSSVYESSFGKKAETIVLSVKPRNLPFGIASSSSYLGHSLNFGKVDLVTVIAADSIFADSFATALSNRIKEEEDIEEVLNFAKSSNYIDGILIAFDGKLYLWGNLEFAR